MTQHLTAPILAAWIREFGQLVSNHKDRLNALDAAIGDADHGTNLDRGFRVVVAGLDATRSSPGDLLGHVGGTVISNVGGAAGPLFGAFFLGLGEALGDETTVDADRFATGLRAGLAGVVARGRADSGDKTMYDALAPAVEAFAGTGDLRGTLQVAVRAAESGRDATIGMLARKGRASYLGERSVGHQDPGATSAALLFTAAAHALT
ncbi:dihydroxyacetone kinase subunit DhaL [Kribbella sp. HUAS MG21]|uniref:Dihydroxyacetone kinase subunit DhaL n=1 Tax=Kribbella sp. HUAS MG21 TaxID=3160966 RepID=A0AAU7TF06_9ACTN